jgi:hypothetical protein
MKMYFHLFRYKEDKKLGFRPGVVHTCVIPATWEVDVCRIKVEGQPWQKVSNFISTSLAQW